MSDAAHPSPPEFSLAEVHEAIAATRPDDECLVFRDRRYSWADITDRTRRLANHLIAQGLGVHTERSDLAGHESGQDHLAIYLHNGNEYLEAMLGRVQGPGGAVQRQLPLRGRGAALPAATTARPRAVVVHSAFTPTLAEVLPQLASLRVILQVPDESGLPLLPGAVWYEDALAGASRGPPGGRRGAPTTSTSSTPAAPPACPRACCGATATPYVECFGGIEDRDLDRGVRRRRDRRHRRRCSLRRSCTAPATG